MRKLNFILFASLFFFFLVLPLSFAHNIGCCCEPVARTGSLTDEDDCPANYQFIDAPPPGQTCSVHCDTTLPPPGVAVCGNGICEPGETVDNCPQDCLVAPLPGVCADLLFKESAHSLTAVPVKGEKKIKLSFDVVCDIDYAIISRCEGSDCDDFVEIGRSYNKFFVDDSFDLEWNKDYNYEIKPFYAFQGNFGDPAVISANLGDLECWLKADEEFCISEFFYEQFKDYLTSFGYARVSASSFDSAFSDTVKFVFDNVDKKFNAPFKCDSKNRLVSVGLNCGDEVCVSDARGTRCIAPEDCSKDFNPFGLFSEKTACEGILSPRYCFFDKSTAVVDKCFSCNSPMSCYDYKSQDACSADNCAVGDCVWKNTLLDLSVGVCVSEKFSNCKFCGLKGSSQKLQTYNVSNDVLDACSESKAAALSTALFPCFYDLDNKVSKSCDEVSCYDYKSSDLCAAPPDGIKLAPDNSLISKSSDTCEINVCQWDSAGAGFCFKNADGDNVPDCDKNDFACELDYFPPETRILPSGFETRTDFLNINLLDKAAKTSAVSDKAGTPDYFTYFCVVSPNEQCDDAEKFPIKVSSKRLVLKNLILKDGQTPLANLALGQNTIKFFSEDSSKNLEIIKSMDINACDDCAGPFLLDISVSGGQLIGNALYTSLTTPAITLVFDEPTKISSIELKQDNKLVPLSLISPDFKLSHSFTPQFPVIGSFVLTFNGLNEKNIKFDNPLTYNLVVDPSLAGITFFPEDDAVLDKTSTDIKLEFSRKVSLTKVTLLYDDFKNPLIKKLVERDITNLFSNSDDSLFAAKLSNLRGGRYTVVVDAKGFNSLQLSASSSFSVDVGPPSIRLISPSFAVTPYSVFNVTIESSIPAECRYVPSSVPQPPPVTEFQFLKKFNNLGYLHISDSITIPFGSNESFHFHAYCDFPAGVIRKSFDIELDPDPPVFVSSFAEPEVIAETFTPDSDFYATTLKLQTDKLSFCKFSPYADSFNLMPGLFPGFNEVPKISNSININVSQIKSYSYFVACKGLNDLISTTDVISFNVDPTLSFNIFSSTAKGFSTKNLTFGVVSNKRAFCYWGETKTATNRCMGACVSSFAHYQAVVVPGPGSYKYFVKCVTGTGESAELEIPVFVDSTPPNMLYVYDNTTLAENPEISWFTNKISVSFLGEDEESDISHYLVTLRERDNPKNIVINNLVSNISDGKPFFITTNEISVPLNLTDKTVYRFDVEAENNVGLKSKIMSSDGVEIDVSRAPDPCFNGLKDADETDVDCGGSCDACELTQSCLINSDCESNFCENNVCAPTFCDDFILNGFETDVDCGGSVCTSCILDKSCLQDSDCLSDYCDIDSKLCATPAVCIDGLLSPGETDVDCGGSCESCAQGKNCLEDYDCVQGLVCNPDSKVCSSLAPVEEPFFEPVPVVEEKPVKWPKTLLWILIFLLLIAGVAFVVVKYVVKPKKEKVIPTRPLPIKKPLVPKPSAEQELAKLKDFAEKKLIDEKDWIPLQDIIRKKPLPKDRFNKVLEKLRRIAKVEKVAPKDPLARLRWMLETLPDELKTDLYAKFKLFKKGLLSKEESKELFARLRVTADYYKAHKDEFEKELKSYGKKKKK